MEDLLATLLARLSVSKAFEHTKWFVEKTGERLAGTPPCEKAAAYIQQMMEDYGLDTDMYNFEAYNSHPGIADLHIVTPEERVIDAIVQAHCASTCPNGIKGKLMYLGSGGEEEYCGRDVEGKIVLVELSYAPPRPEKARIAARHGAKAMIIMNWGDRTHDTLPRGAVKSVWGNPTPTTFAEIPQIPVVGISRASGEYLKCLLKGGEVEVWLRVESNRRWEKMSQPVGWIKGTEEPEKFILVGGHFEAWCGGATCNATGNGLMLELARVFYELRDQLRRSVVFAFWNGHEIAEAAGSSWYVDTFWDELTTNGVAYINIDSPGMKGTNRYYVQATPELLEFAKSSARAILGDDTVLCGILTGKHSDMSFYGVGVPSISGRTVFDPSEIERQNGATLGWWYHSEEDTLDKVDLEKLSIALQVNAAHILQLATMPILPMEFETAASMIVDALQELVKTTPDEWLGIESLLKEAEQLKRAATSLKQTVALINNNSIVSDKREALNRCLMNLSRVLLPLTHTVAGRYAHDPYGLSVLQHTIPSLAPVASLHCKDQDSLEYKLLRTELRRRRNRAMDAIRSARELVCQALADMKGGDN